MVDSVVTGGTDKKKLWLLVGLAGGVLLLGWFSYSALEPEHALFHREPQILVSSGTIAMGGSLYTSLTREGLSGKFIAELARAMKPHWDPKYSRPQDRYEISRSTAGSFLSLRYWVNNFDYVDVTRAADQALLVSKDSLPLDENTMAVQGTITGSLWESLSGQGLSPELIMRFADVFAWKVDFLTEPRNGDTYKIIWKRKSHGLLSAEGEILAASYNGSFAGEHTGVLFHGEYFDPAGQSLRRQFLRAPLNYRRISSHFTGRRFHPILRVFRPHHGVDYAAAYGTPVVSIGNGTVVFTGWKGGNGRLIKVRHNGTYTSSYGHLSRYARGIRGGARVQQGQVIGYVGSTGLSTGPHLHFGFERNGAFVNFERQKWTAVGSVAAQDRAQFQQLAQTVSQELAGITTPGIAPLGTKVLAQNTSSPSR